MPVASVVAFGSQVLTSHRLNAFLPTSTYSQVPSALIAETPVTRFSPFIIIFSLFLLGYFKICVLDNVLSFPPSTVNNNT